MALVIPFPTVSQVAVRARRDDDWRTRANCLGIVESKFFASSTRAAKEVCRGCTVRAECLAFAEEHGERFGVWGGLTPAERRRRRRRLSTPDAEPNL